MATFLVLGVAWSWRQLDVSYSQLGVRGLVLATLLAVPAALLSAAEYWLAQRLVDGSASVRESISVSLLGSLGNLLPIPGGALVRVEAMTSSGSRLSVAVRTTAGIGLVWVGLTLAASGAAVWVLGRPTAGLSMALGGAVACALGTLALRPRTRRTARLTAAVFVVEALVILIATWRIHLVLGAIGIAAAWSQAFGIVASGAVAVSIGVVPAGLGVREVLAGALAPLVGLSAAAGFLTAGINQALSLVGQGALAAVALPAWGARRRGRQPSS